MTERNEMIAAIEAVLFVSPDPVSRRRLMDLFTEEEQEEAVEAVQAVEARHRPPSDGSDDGRGMILEEVAGGLRLVTRPDLNEWLRCFFEAGRGRKLSIGALETLAIVAYRQPVTGPEIQELRSVNPAGVLKTLLERRLVRIAGRKEVVGKPFLYATSQDFLVHFGLRSLKDLPPLEEFEEALAGEGLGELLGGTDLEEVALREAVAAEEALDDRLDEVEEAVEEEAAEQEVVSASLEEEDEPAQDGALDEGALDEGALEDGALEDGEAEDVSSPDELPRDEEFMNEEPEADGDEAVAAGVEAGSDG